MFAPRHTLLLITSRVLARVDLAGGRQLRVKNVWAQPCSEASTPAAAAATALELGPRPTGRVWVFSNDFWTGVVGLAADVSPLLTETELQQALALEAEIESGISAFASRVAAVRLAQQSADDYRWCVTHVSIAELQHLCDALEHTRVRVAGVAHPAAAEITQAAAEGTIDTDAIFAAWEERLRLAAENGPEEIAAALAHWAKRWAECLAHAPQAALAIRCEDKPLSAKHRLLASAALALLTAAPCGLWHWHSQQRIADAAQSIATLEEQQTAQEATQRNLQALEARVAKLRNDTLQAHAQRRELENALLRADRTHAQQNQRWLALLDAIAGSIDSRCWIQRLESQPVQATVHGLALDNAAAHRFASALEVGLEGSGWTVLPAETKPAGNQLVSFKIVLDASASPSKAEQSEVAKLTTPASSRSGEAFHVSRLPHSRLQPIAGRSAGLRLQKVHFT